MIEDAGAAVRIAVFLLSSLTLLATAVDAAPVEEQEFASYGSAELIHCIDGASGTTGELLECSAEEWIRQKKSLDKTYRTIAQTLSRRERHLLDRSQRQWIARRERICDAYLVEQWGTLEWLMYKSCFPGETEKRVEWLRRRYLLAQ